MSTESITFEVTVDGLATKSLRVIHSVDGKRTGIDWYTYTHGEWQTSCGTRLAPEWTHVPDALLGAMAVVA